MDNSEDSQYLSPPTASGPVPGAGGEPDTPGPVETPSPRPPAGEQPGAPASGDAPQGGESAPRPRPAAAQPPQQAAAPASAGQGRKVRDWLRNPPRPRTPAPDRQGFTFQIGVTLAVAFLLATLFTTWTPGLTNASPDMPPPATLIAQVLQPSPTTPAGAPPTATLANPNKVGLVAGHWKNDSGAVCPDGLKEVDINLNIATRVQKILQEQGYQVDVLKEFDERLADYQAAALVSIHNDSCNFINNDATGYKVAAAMGTRHPERAALLTACLRARYGQATRKPVHSTSVTPDMTSYHAFGEIDESTPAAIIETGFMNLDRELLTQQPEVVAQGVASGILCYLRNEPLVTPTAPAAKPTFQAPNP